MSQPQELNIAARAMIMLLAIVFTASCQHNTVNLPERTQGDSVSWEDSAYQLNVIANHLFNEGKVDSLETFVPVAMQTCLEHHQMERYYIIWRVLIEQYIWIDEYDKAMLMARDMESDANRRHENHGLFEAYSLLGIGYGYRGNSSESVKYFRKAIAIFQSKNVDPLMEAYYYLAQAMTDSTLRQELKPVLAEWKAQIDRNHYSQSSSVTPRQWAQWNYLYQRQRSEYLIATHQYTAASAAIDSAQHYLKLGGDQLLDRISLLRTRISLELMQHDYEAALGHSNEMLEWTRETSDNSHKINATYQNVKALQGLGRYREAQEWLQKVNAIKDSLTTADNIEQLNLLNKRFEVNKLKMKTERNQMKAKEHQLFLFILITVVAIITLIIFIIYRHRATDRLKKVHSDLREAYAQLEVANAKAEESSRMKTNFIRQISHEINTPLNILSGFTQLLTMPDIELSQEEREKLNEGIAENTNRITGLVNKVIELSDVSTQSAIERSDQVEASLIAIDAIQSSGISQAPHLEFSQQLSDEAGSTILTTNEKSASRALSLLLDNAIKFTTPAEASAGHQGKPAGDEKKHVRLIVTKDEAHVTFTVEDDGIGVPPGEAEHIFEEFVQLNDYYQGTGIGLTIARSQTRKIGGDITLDTSYHDGARFVMTLPL